MHYISRYISPLGEILLAADGDGLTGLWFAGQKYFAAGLTASHAEGENDSLQAAKRWLDIYFSGREPGFIPPLNIFGTPFQMAVWDVLREIPYGQTATYGQVAAYVAQRRGKPPPAAQAVGNAVGRNPLALIVPCHRVVGANGSLVGYAGGLDKKRWLLRLEGSD